MLTVLLSLRSEKRLSLDTETTGLRPHHGDRPFAIIIGTEKAEHYFELAALDQDERHHLSRLLVQQDRTWYLMNASFDLHMLAVAGFGLGGTIHDIRAIERVLDNDRFSYSLDAIAPHYGMKKSNEVEEYIKEHKLWEWVKIPGKKQRGKLKFYDRVPRDIMRRYACTDGRITYDIGVRQEEQVAHLDVHAAIAELTPIAPLVDNERELTVAGYAMERVGVQIDVDYTRRAIEHETGRREAAEAQFYLRTGKEYLDSGKLFAEVLAPSGRSTATGKVSYDAAALEAMAERGDELAGIILNQRDAKKRLDFLEGFLYHADHTHRLRGSFDQAGAKTGRSSARDPNLQQLTKDADGSEEFPIRRAIVPSDGFFLAMLDYDQVEYRMMLDYAGRYTRRRSLIEKVLGGLDVHAAVAELAGVTRQKAKVVNFLTIYGGGDAVLAANLGCSLAEARAIRQTIFAAAPEIEIFVKKCMLAAERRGYVVNWFGRRWHCPDPKFSYKAANAVIQGGAADVAKVAMVRCSKFLEPHRSRLVLMVHDELIFEIHESERFLVPELKRIMETVYPHSYLPLTVGCDWSPTSLADKQEWLGE